MKIRYLLKLGVLALTICSLNVMAAGGPNVVVGTGSGVVGSATPVVIPVSYNGDGTVVGIEFEVAYDNTNLSADLSSCGGAIGGATALCSEAVAGIIKFLAFDQSFTPLPDGSLGSVSFDVSAAPIADYALTVQNELYGDAQEGDVPSTGSTDGLVQVVEGPQPDWSSTPDSATGFDFGSHTTGTGTYQMGMVVTNTGAAGSLLTGDCDVSGSAVFSVLGDIVGLGMGESDSIFAVCDTTGAAVQLHTGTMSCTHNGDGTTETSITDYALSCNVTATPEPSFLGVDNGLSAMDVVEQGDPDATATLAVSNNGDSGTTLIGSCVYAGDPEITVANGSFAVAQGDPAVNVIARCSGDAEGSYTGTLTCGPADPQTWVAPDSPYAVSCTVGPPGDAVYSSIRAPGSVYDMTPPGEPVPVGATIPDRDLVITNDPPEANDRDLALLNCALTGGAGAISATAAVSPLAPYESTTVTFSCDSTNIGDFTDTYSCSYDVDGDGAADGTATYTVNCAVRAAESEVTPTPADGTTVTIYTPLGGAGQGSVLFSEVLDEDEDGTLNDCFLDDETYFSILAPASFPQTVSSGASVEVLVEGMGTPDGLATSTTLYCDYTDSQNQSMQVSWPLEVVILAAGIPTLSTWGLMLMILSLLGLGGLVIRRKEHS